MDRLKGKVALVTGASRGLGRGIALCFAEEGAKVGVNYRNSEREAGEVVAAIEARGSEAIALRADVKDEPQVREMVERVVERFGRLDILVSNAGEAKGYPLVEMPVEVWDELLAVHLRGCFLCAKYAVPHMLRQGSGKIINMAGTFGISGGANFTHLSAAKAGMIGFTRALALELGPKNIHVNAIAPAMIKTELLKNFDPQFLESLAQKYPLRRLGEIREVTATALFLASEDSDFFTGQTLCPAGGEVMV